MDRQISALNAANAKTIKALQYQVKMVVAAGSVHQVLNRTTISSKDYANEVEVIEGTYNFFKIEMKGLLQPLKLFFKYQDMPENALFGDLNIFMSSKVDKPDENHCERRFIKPGVITLDQLDAHFHYEYLYIKMVSTYGCKMLVKVVFPKEDVRDRQKEQEALHTLELMNVANKTKSKQQLDIEAKINRMILDPRLYDEFLEEFAKKKKQFILARQSAKQILHPVDLIKRNKQRLRNFNSQVTQEKQQRLEQ